MKLRGIGVAAVCVMLAGGCATDMKSKLASDEKFSADVMTAYRSDGTLAARMVDNLLGSDSTRGVVIDRIMANGEASQTLMMRTARDRNMMNGVIALAVADSGMRNHVLTLLKGIEIGDGTR